MENSENNLNESWHMSELLFALSGVFILVSALVIYHTHDFTIWSFAKVFYAIAVLLFVKYA